MLKQLLVFTALCMTIIMPASAQSQPEKLVGLGKFKIGQTTIDVIKELETELKVKAKPVKTREALHKAKVPGAIVEIIYDSTLTLKSGAPVYANACPSVRVFELSSYTIAGFSVTNLTLRFYQGKLFEIMCLVSPELLEAMHSKYGAPTIHKSDSDKDCRDKEGKSKLKYSEQTTFYIWPSAGSTESTIIKSNKREGENCEEKWYTTVNIYDNDMIRASLGCAYKIKKRIEANAKAAKQKELSDL